MTIKLVKRPPNGVLLKLEGRLDTISAPSAREAFLKVADEYADITLDFTALAYLSSAGLRALLTLQKQVNRTGATLTLTNVNSSVMEIFEMTGFNGMLNIV